MNLKGANVLITGGAGFIGSELTRQLCVAGARVTVVDNLINGRRENLDEVEGEFSLKVVDIRDEDQMSGLVRRAQVIFHLACLGVRHSIHSPAENHEVNTTGTLQLLELARHGGVEKFVYVSSSEVYGTAQSVPIKESHPTFPMTVYGAAKLAAERYTAAYHQVYGMRTVVVRPFNAYGPRSHHEGDSGEVIPKFMLRCLAGEPMIVFGDGLQTRDFTYVSDTAAGIMAAGVSDASVGQTFNLGQSKEMTINEVAETVARVVDVEGSQVLHDEPRPGDVLRLYADSSFAREVLGFKPEVSFENGLKRLLEWYKRSGVSPAELLSQERVRNWEKPLSSLSRRARA